MRWKFVWKKPILTLTQVIALVVILFGLFVALDLNRRAQAGKLVGKDEDTLRAELETEKARQNELQVTREYVYSEEYVAVYAREEGGYILPGEKRIVVLPIEVDPDLVNSVQPTPDPAQFARPWQAWWQLLTDLPMPSE